MPKFEVVYLETVDQKVVEEVDANDRTEAVEAVQNGDGERVGDPRVVSGYLVRVIGVNRLGGEEEMSRCHNPNCRDYGKDKPADSEDFRFDAAFDLTFCSICGGTDVY